MKNTDNSNSVIVTAKVPRLRDPFILVDDDTYYMYGSGWHCWKNTSGNLAGEWIDLGVCVTIPENANGNFWAPEVHKYKGVYYMFTTYLARSTNHRGCSVFKAEHPEGPFVEISSGHITPKTWDSIDGTLFVDDDGQPWMVFVHEWTSTDDGIGRMNAAKLSDDLSHFTSTPIELFRADDPSWTNECVTDGPWMHKCQDGTLLMIWSNDYPHGYCVAIARSDNGKIDGHWHHDNQLLYSKEMSGDYDGGHGMIFSGLDGKMYLSVHSPDNINGGRFETPVFVPIKENGNTLIWDV